MPLFNTPTARANVQPTEMQVTRNNFPYSMAFVQPEATNRINMQQVQDRNMRWLGNLDALLARERARMALDDSPVTPGTGPKPVPGTDQAPGQSNGGWSGGCGGKCGGCGGGCK